LEVELDDPDMLDLEFGIPEIGVVDFQELSVYHLEVYGQEDVNITIEISNVAG
jgi:hypothetical protein